MISLQCVGLNEARRESSIILLQHDLAGNLIGRVREMPADIDIDIDIPVLTVFVDQGPIGMAALNFIMGHLRLMMIARYNAFHRGFRYIVGASMAGDGNERGTFRRTMLMTGFISL